MPPEVFCLGRARLCDSGRHLCSREMGVSWGNPPFLSAEPFMARERSSPEIGPPPGLGPLDHFCFMLWVTWLKQIKSQISNLHLLSGRLFCFKCPLPAWQSNAQLQAALPSKCSPDTPRPKPSMHRLCSSARERSARGRARA